MPPEWSPPPEFDEYRILRLLGRGRTGQVYLAQDTLLDRTVAVKFIPAPDSEQLARFLVEARAAARVQHPNVATLYRVGQVQDRAYLVSEFVRGESLDRVRGPLPTERVLDIAADLARGLSAAHRGGVLHRDIKPGNAVQAESGDVKLVDFGLARILDARDQEGPAQPSPARAPVGTPYFIAPEIWRGDPATARSDLWSLGAVLYELAAGRGPFRDVPFTELARKVQEEDAPPLSPAAPGLDPRLAAVIDRALQRDPAARFSSADELLDALEETRPGRSQAVPEGNPYRGLEAFDARHRALFFGRRRDLRTALDRLRREPFVLITGDSGVGKSSLCLAGIVPEVLEGQLADGRRYRAVRLVPGRRPLGALAAALSPVLEVEEGTLEEQLRLDPARVLRGLRLRLGAAQGVLLYVDQLEELVTLATGPGTAALALGLLADDLPGVKLLASARSDFLTRLASLPVLGDAVPRALLLLRALRPEEIREVIVAPARATQTRFESEALVDELVASTVSAEGSLPLLQFALAELWLARERGVITAATVSRIGGVAGALSRHADAVVDGLLPQQRAAARKLLLRLVTLEGTRARREQATLAPDEAARLALEALVRGWLLVVREVEGSSTVEIAHEALVSGWSTLGRWLSEEAEGRALRGRLEVALREHERNGALWAEPQLAEISALPESELLPREREFLQASRRALRRRRILRRALVAGFAASLLAVYGAVKLRASLERESEILAQLGQAKGSLSTALRARDEWRARRADAFELFDAKKRAEAEAAWKRALAAEAALQRAFSVSAVAHEQLAPQSGRLDGVREQLAQFLYERARLAQEQGRPTTELVERLKLYDAAGRRAAALLAPARLRLRSSPPSTATAAPIDGQFHEGPARPISTDAELAPGSWMLTLTSGARPPVRLAVLLAPGEELTLAPSLPARVPGGFVYVPAGRFLFGAAAEESVREFFNTPPIHQVATGPFFIARHETTYRDWIAWLDALPPAERSRRAPHVGAQGLGGQLDLHRAGAGWELSIQLGGRSQRLRRGDRLQLPARDRRREADWLDLPVAGVSRDDARAYAAWLSASVPRARLCTEHEWERAARGADAREFPSGDTLSPEDADFDLTYGKQPAAFGPDPVGAHPASRSPYGVDDMAGNVWEWVDSSVAEGESVARGGSYYSAANTCRATNRELPEATFRALIVGVRICTDLAE